MTPEEARRKYLNDLIAALELSLKGGETVLGRKPDTVLERYISYPEGLVGAYELNEFLELEERQGK